MKVRSIRFVVTAVLLLALASVSFAAPNRGVVRPRCGLGGTSFGYCQLLLRDVNRAYVLDKTPASEPTYGLDFRIDSAVRARNANGQMLTVVSATQGPAGAIFNPARARIQANLFRRNPASPKLDRLEIWIFEKDQTRKIPVGLVKNDTLISIQWIAKTRTQPGSVVVMKNGVVVQSITGLKTKGYRIDNLAVGNLGGFARALKREVALDEINTRKL